jgi:type II secretory pathway component PulK
VRSALFKVQSSEFGVRRENRRTGNERGVALIIVLLVTALLIALIFEFAYATRISLRAAVNYRDSQRAYYLARSGVNFVGRYLVANMTPDATGNDRSRDDLETREWQTVPFMPGNDAELRVKWDDEAGRIRIDDVKTKTFRQDMLKLLFEDKEIDQSVLDRMMENESNINNIGLLTRLHQFMNDEDYDKVYHLLTVNSKVKNKININTAPEDVLRSLGLSLDTISLIIDDRENEPITNYINYGPVQNEMFGKYKLTIYLTDKSDNFKVYSYATVGGYTKQVEASITRSKKYFKVNYWRAL